jgi:predicted nucleic acid-binding protein
MEVDSDKTIEVMATLDKEKTWLGYTSSWATLEIARALKKDGKPKELILLNLRELKRHKISFVKVSDNLLKEAEEIIATRNLYASDALHVATFKTLETQKKLDGFLCDDAHFQRLRNLLKTITLGEIKIP